MKILISAGPTREPIDPVRFISNRSSGKMGYALASAAIEAGHEVYLVSGPVNIEPPIGLNKLIYVQTAAEMFDAITAIADKMQMIIMTAAVADYTPKYVPTQKVKKSQTALTIELEPTKDILKHLGEHKANDQILVGFAAETNNVEAYAQDKLKRKNCNWIIANDVSRKDIGFDSHLNAVTIFGKSGEIIALPIDSKQKIAHTILSIVEGEKRV